MTHSSSNSGRSRSASREHSSSPAGDVGHSSVLPDLEPNSIVTRSAAFVEPHHRESMIAEAAYYLAERRAFDPGHDVEDWIAAEQQIDAALARGDVPAVDSTRAGEDAPPNAGH